MSHILPREYTETLSVLQDQAPHVSFKDVETVFMREFGKHPDEMYVSMVRHGLYFPPTYVFMLTIISCHSAFSFA